MRESPNKRAVVVGIFVFVGLAFLAAGILMIGNLHETFTNKVTLIAYFEDVNGLQTGNNVWFSGVKVGTVKDIHFHSRTKVEVGFKVDLKAKKYIRKDSKVKISTDGFIGNKILVVYGGTDKTGEVEEGDSLMVEKMVSQEEVLKILQESNKNLLSITTDMKSITKKIDSGEGSIGKLLNEDVLYRNLNETLLSVQRTSSKGQQFMNNLNEYTAKMNQDGTLANDLVTDTVVFNSIRSLSKQLKQMADSATVLVSQLKKASADTTTSVGVMLHDPESGARMKEIIKNLESSSKKLDEDLEAAQHSWPLKKYFKKKEQ